MARRGRRKFLGVNRMARRRRRKILVLGNVCLNGGIACGPSAAVCRFRDISLGGVHAANFRSSSSPPLPSFLPSFPSSFLPSFPQRDFLRARCDIASDFFRTVCPSVAYRDSLKGGPALGCGKLLVHLLVHLCTTGMTRACPHSRTLSRWPSVACFPKD